MYRIFNLFVEEVQTSDIQVVITYPIDKYMVQVTFRGETEQVRQWLDEIPDSNGIVYMEIRSLYDVTKVLTYGTEHAGEIHKIERNSLELEFRHLSCEGCDVHGDLE